MTEDLILLEKPIEAECACCVHDETSAVEVPLDDLSRRRFLSAAAALGAAGAILAACGSNESKPQSGSTESSPPAEAKVQHMDLAFCSQVLCVLPYEVANRQGFFKEQGFEVNLVYMKGGALAMNALLGKSIDWVGTPMDLVVSAWGSGKQAVMVVSTSSLPFFALMAGPKTNINAIADLKGKKIGINNFNTTDHLLARFLLSRAGIKDDQVTFVPLGANLYDGLTRAQVEAGMVQEPSLTLVERAGGKVLVNLMKKSDAQETLGGGYQFMGLNTRPEVLQAHPDTPKRLAAALVKANDWIRAHPGSEIVKNVPPELVAGGDDAVFAASLDLYKNDLYPANGKIDQDSVQRVVDVQKLSGALENDVQASTLFTNQYLS